MNVQLKWSKKPELVKRQWSGCCDISPQTCGCNLTPAENSPYQLFEFWILREFVVGYSKSLFTHESCFSTTLTTGTKQSFVKAFKEKIKSMKMIMTKRAWSCWWQWRWRWRYCRWWWLWSSLVMVMMMMMTIIIVDDDDDGATEPAPSPRSRPAPPSPHRAYHRPVRAPA